ncbi:flagellar filament capping protein FliD [Pararhodospirillum oryzae]|uniref:Flagellar hook-associated protein 2 n=1 Tax=Pararhodospirillum oryzae TaxID=478448 RepID=A0A512H4H8_9PROT|nr:flagellar filament capping protein FliD [Pararhodospirillum oryzae]GEO80341.1 flagellar hook-associated protein 2 [Pararhodospirillum oryzae]
MTTITSSSYVTGSSGTTYLSGLSDLDTSALIEAAVEAKMQPAYRLDDKISALETEESAFSEMTSLLSAVSEALEPLASASVLSSSSDTTSAFAGRSAYLTSSLDTPANYVGLTVTDEADLGNYTLSVEQLATTQKVASQGLSAGTALGVDGSFTLQADDGTAVDITVDASMTASDIAEAINEQSATSGVVATVVRTGSNEQTLVLSSVNTGQAFTLTETSGTAGQALGLVDSSGDFVKPVQEAQQAILTLDGVTVTSDSNDIKDLLPGVSVNLYAATGGETIAVEVGQDLGAALDAIEAFVEAYNAYREFALTQQATDESGAADDAVLFGDSTLKGVNAALYSALNTSVTVDGTTYTLSDMGLSFNDDNTLALDGDVIEEMLLQNPDVVEAFFCSSVSCDSSSLGVVSLPATMPSGTYTLDIDVDEATGKIASATLNGVALTVSGTTLSGPDGSIYEDLWMGYSGTGDATITLAVSTGLADALTTAIDDYTNAGDGRITTRLSSIADDITGKQEKRDRIAERAGDYEERMIAYYAKLEEQISMADIRLQQIEALFYGDDD